ncbi:MAG: hypothetical protein Q7J24_06080 [Desulfomicrobium sp.]|nr:hypothetical protein [Desulfomicrobium sp.]
MKPFLRKMRSRLANIGDAMTPAKPIIVGVSRPGGLIEFKDKLWKSLEQIHAAHPGQYGHDPEGCVVIVVDGSTGEEGPAPWKPGDLERMEVMP